MLLKKKNNVKSTKMIVDDIRYSFDKILSQNNPILAITINGTHCKSTEELRFHLTNKYFNKLNKDYKNTSAIINYLFVIEYPTVVSQCLFVPKNCDVHTHIVLGTTISEKEIKQFTENVFKGADIHIKDITKRSDKLNYVNYLTKQRDLLTIDNYNYKVLI